MSYLNVWMMEGRDRLGPLGGRLLLLLQDLSIPLLLLRWVLLLLRWLQLLLLLLETWRRREIVAVLVCFVAAAVVDDGGSLEKPCKL